MAENLPGLCNPFADSFVADSGFGNRNLLQRLSVLAF